MRTSHVGLILGALLGLALILQGFAQMLVVALMAGLGWLIARVLTGEMDLNDLVPDRRNDPSRRSRF